MKKKMLALSMAVLMAASLAGCSSGAKETETTAAASEAGAETAAESEGETAAEDAEEEKTAEGGTLIMGTNATFPPYEYYEGDEIVGIDVEIAQAIGEKLGMEVTVEDMEFDALIPALASNKVDIVAAGMTVTGIRKLYRYLRNSSTGHYRKAGQRHCFLRGPERKDSGRSDGNYRRQPGKRDRGSAGRAFQQVFRGYPVCASGQD